MQKRPVHLRRTRNVTRSKAYRPAIEWIESRTLLAAVLWTGGGGDTNWDDPLNWNTSSVPGPADDVTINTGTGVTHADAVADSINSLTSTQPLTISAGSISIAAASTISSTLTMTGGAVDIQTGSLELDGGGSSTGGAFTIDGTLNLASPFTFDTATTIDGSGVLEQTSASTLILPGTYTFSGNTLISAGVLQVDGSLASSSVIDDATLTGTGTVDAIGVDTGTVSPGDGASPGMLSAHGSVGFTGPGATFSVALNGAAAGSGYSQLNATGQVSLTDVTLDASLGFTPSSGEQFTIITSTVPIVGTFAGLPEGSTVPIGGTNFTISYVGGGGDDVVLTAPLTAAPTVTGLSPTRWDPLESTCRHASLSIL